MALLTVHDLDSLTNESEEIVHVEIERQLKQLPDYICTCKECLLDVMALALNSIKPLYRVSLMGKIYTDVAMSDKTYATKVTEAVFKAIETVHKNPAHPPHNKTEDEDKALSSHYKQKKNVKAPKKP